MSWHNCEFDEDAPGCRVLGSHSTDGRSWAPPYVLFASLPGSPPPPPHPTPARQAEQVGTAPFCALDTASGSYYIKVGGEASVRCGWDGGKKYDKCCRRLPTDCRWFKNLSACQAKLPLASSSADYCLPCGRSKPPPPPVLEGPMCSAPNGRPFR